jgi:hypothetical protein
MLSWLLIEAIPTAMDTLIKKGSKKMPKLSSMKPLALLKETKRNYTCLEQVWAVLSPFMSQGCQGSGKTFQV